MVETIKQVYRDIFRKDLQLDKVLLKKYREFDTYELDEEVYPAARIHIPQRLPSEPPEGITYEFGPSGYVGDHASGYCVVPTTWRSVNNYCHWTFSELPYLLLAFASPAKHIGLPRALLQGKQPFQKRWIQLLRTLHPEKKPVRLDKSSYPDNALIPVNHDTSTRATPIGKCQYRNYHYSRATPYLIDAMPRYVPHFAPASEAVAGIDKVYIGRTTRTLRNETAARELVRQHGFQVVSLEKLTLDDQVALFANARTIIGFHGAGLANLVFCNPQARVIELVDRDCVHPCYLDGVVIPAQKMTRTYFHMLSVMKGLDYTALESQDYVLDLDRLEEAVLAVSR